MYSFDVLFHRHLLNLDTTIVIVDTGYLAAMSATCTMNIQSVPGLKNKFLGGEGLFNTVVTGPGKVVLQTLPISAVANSIRPFIPTSS